MTARAVELNSIDLNRVRRVHRCSEEVVFLAACIYMHIHVYVLLYAAHTRAAKNHGKAHGAEMCTGCECALDAGRGRLLACPLFCW